MIRIESMCRLIVVILLFPCSLFAMERVEQAPQAPASQVRPVPALTELALPKFFDYCNLNNIDASKQTSFPKDKLLELIKQSSWAWHMFRPALIRHLQPVNSAQFSSDSKKVITASHDKRALVTDVLTGAEMLTICHDNWVKFAHMSPDFKMIVTASGDEPVIIKIFAFEMQDAAQPGAVLTTVRHRFEVNSVQFSPDSRMVVTASSDGTAKIINIEHNDCIPIEHAKRVNSAKFSPDSTKIITASDDHTARIVMAHSGRACAEIRHNGIVNYAEFSPDGKVVVTASDDMTVRISDATSGQTLAIFEHESLVKHAFFNLDGSKIITSSIDKIRVTNIESREIIMELEGNFAQFSPDSRLVVVIAEYSKLRVFSAMTGECLYSTTAAHGEIWSAQFSPNSMMIAAGCRNGKTYASGIWGFNVADDDELIKRLQALSRGVATGESYLQNLLQSRLVQSFWSAFWLYNRRSE